MLDLNFTEQPEKRPRCGGDQLRLKGTHVAELDADFDGEDRTDYGFDNWHGWLGSIDCRCTDCDHDWTVDAQGESRTITIHVERGAVHDVTGLPDGWGYDLDDKDCQRREQGLDGGHIDCEEHERGAPK